MITQELLHMLFEYKNNDLYWKVNRKANKIQGTKAGCLDGRGYLQTRVNNILYKNQRLIFMMHFGRFPLLIDHIDGNSKNHKIDNLRMICPNCHSQTETYCGKNK